MHERMIKSAPGPTLRRLPAYHRVLKQLARRGRESASCTTIARELASDPTQVRKDLSVTGLPGKPKVGYPVKELIAAIEEFLGWNNVSDAFLVGAGNLGAALLGFEGFENHGLNIVAAFDTDPRKVNATIHGKTVLPMDKMFDLAARLHVQIGILTVPAGAAQEVANMLILAGIRGIWNFTPVRIEAPAGIIVENQDLSVSLAVLSARLAEAQRNELSVQE